ncbi:phage-like protein [Acinetobacter pittii]|uniref:phage nozzle protein n=1 Tax=Acinetobacter pittii TaxID=48296 RepID=UPI000DE6F721|nr:hypothetical protein [Acinetobacter pittii]SSP30244.1 phage-like protein [Acinetobacter pittii]
MAKINLIKNNFTSGELSPHIWLRTDLSQFRNGAKAVENMLPIIEGGIKKRGGTKLLRVEQDAIRIIPFIVSHSKNYLIVLRPNLMNILDSEGTLIRTFSTLYTKEQIPDINFCQSRYNLWLVHSNHPISWIRCSEDFSNWAYDRFTYSVPPLEETATPTLTLKSSEMNVGKTTTLTASIYAAHTANKQYIVGDICYLFGANWTMKYYRCLVDHMNQVPKDEYATTTDPETGDIIYTETVYWQKITPEEAVAFNSSIVGKYIFINSGVIRVDRYVSATQVTGEILVKLSANVEAIARSWTIKEPIFNETYGYPRAITYFQQRLVLAGSKKYPNYIWLSRTGDESNFLTTTQDGDSFTVAASSEQLSNVLHLSQSRGIVVFCGGSELTINAQNSLSPTNANILEHTAYGTVQTIKPIKVGSELLFVQRGAERVRTLVYDYTTDGLVSNELSVLASHIGEEGGGFKEFSYQQEPDSVIWFVMNNGKLATLTLDREQSVISWARHDIGGKVISIASLPSTTGADKVYFLVNRDGIVQIEQLQENLLLDTAVELAVTHTEDGCTVTHSLIGILGDNNSAYYKDSTYTYAIPILQREGNTIHIECDAEVQTIYIGRKFTAKVSLLPPDISQAPTTSNPALFKVDHLNLYMYKTINPKVNGEIVELKDIDDDSLEKPKPFTGQRRISLDGWNTYDNFKLEITQDEPLPFHITAAVLELNMNDR